MAEIMISKMMSKDFWIKQSFYGGLELRKHSKILVTVMPFVLAVLLYYLLIVIEGLESGAEIIMILAYGAIVLMVALMLLVIIVSIIDYLRRFE